MRPWGHGLWGMACLVPWAGWAELEPFTSAMGHGVPGAERAGRAGEWSGRACAKPLKKLWPWGHEAMGAMGGMAAEGTERAGMR